jgi:hypothetical protein
MEQLETVSHGGFVDGPRAHGGFVDGRSADGGFRKEAVPGTEQAASGESQQSEPQQERATRSAGDGA